MNVNKENIAALTVSLIGLAVLGWWLTVNPADDLSEHIPGMDNRPKNLAAANAGEIVAIGEFFQTYDGEPASIPGSWPRFRGADYDNISKETIRLKDSWGDGKPEILWSVELGEGHAAPAVHNGRVYVLDYDEAEQADALRCFSLADGKEIWRRWYHVQVKRNHGMSRTVPAVIGKYVVSMGPRCHVMCVNSQSGDSLWSLDLEKDFETKVPFWYTGQCPLIDDTVAVIAPGGKALMIGVDCANGKILWQTPNPQAWQMSHASIIPVTIRNKKMYVYPTVGGLIGVSAESDDRGALLWSAKAWSHSVIAPSAVHLGNARLFLTAGYGAGSMVVQIHEQNGSYSVEVINAYPPKDGIASEQQTPVLYNGRLFAILPKDAGPLRNQFVCVDPADCTDILWSSGQTNRFGLGPYIVADNKFFILNDDGVLTVLKASTTEYIRTAQVQILEGHDAWGPIAVVNGHMLLRDSKRLVCIDVRDMSVL